MSNDEFWALKIVALLHDPPDKLLLGLKDHETRTEPLLQKVLGRTSSLEDWPEWNIARKADAVAASMDRAAFPDAVAVSPKDETADPSGATLYWAQPEVHHSLSGRPYDLPKEPVSSRQAVSQRYNDVLDLLTTKFGRDLEKLYLALWRRLPEAVAPVWRLVPADTRMVDHSLWDHLDATAAVAGALDRPGLMIFSLSPAQRFIQQARRTQDLWIGSYILSFLTWQAAQAIVHELGPDAVLYPALRGQPMFDYWLHKESGILDESPRTRRIAMATLPNRLVAIVPAGSAQLLAQGIVLPAVRSAWSQMAGAVLDHLSQLHPLDATWQQIWSKQTGSTASSIRDAFWEPTWSYHAWPQTRPSGDPEPWREAQDALEQYQRLNFPSGINGKPDVPANWHFGNVYSVYKGVKNGRFVNVGTVYSLMHRLAGRGFDARRGLHDFAQVEERGEKCTVCGERSALHGSNTSREGVRSAWSDLGVALQAKGRYAELRPDGRERLCAICSIKRFAQRAFFESAVELRGGFPSTSTIAAASFREELILALKDKSTDHELWQVLRDFLEALHVARSRNGKLVPSTVPEEAIPRLWHLVEQHFSGADRSRLQAFLKYDGDLLYPETYTYERFRDDYRLDFDATVLSDLRSKLVRLRKTAEQAKVRAPASYFAILMLDGDNMGAWLAGDHLPAFREALNSDVVSLFGKQFERGRLTDWQPLLDKASTDARRLLGPASHAAISHALSNFALHCAQQLIEDLYPGRVVYAGGDDLLALLPADCALAAARELRALYSGEAEVALDTNGNFVDIRVNFGEEANTGYLELGDDVLLTMGPTATASTGIAIAHHQAPLDGVLAAAREAVDTAKEGYGRNAVTVFALKRSGAPLRIGSQWSYGGLADPIHLFHELRDHFREGALSPKLAYDVVEQAWALPIAPTKIHRPGVAPISIPQEAVRSGLERLLLRHKGDQVSKDEASGRAKALSGELTRWATALDHHRQTWETDWLREHQHDQREPDPLDEDLAPQPGAMELGNWLLLARFLERGGEE